MYMLNQSASPKERKNILKKTVVSDSILTHTMSSHKQIDMWLCWVWYFERFFNNIIIILILYKNLEDHFKTGYPFVKVDNHF